MDAYILVAGIGSRLEKADPKSLTPLISGETILARQVRLIKKTFPNAQIHLIVGYKKELIEQAFPHISTIENPKYAEENTAGSLKRALLQAKGDVLFMNGDVVFQEQVLKPLKKCTHSIGVVNQGPVGEEEIKYTLENCAIKDLSKNIANGLGEALGIWLIKKELLKPLQEALEATDPKEYFEKAIELCIAKGALLYPLTVSKNSCIEVDFPEDLQKANSMLSTWKLDI